MARLPYASEIYAAAEMWLQNCLIGDMSVFMPEQQLWSIENVRALREAFTGNPIQGEAKFEEKFRQQLQGRPPELALLGAEMLWVLFLFPRKTMLPKRKRELIRLVASWGSLSLGPEHPLLSDAVMGGIGKAGTAFNTQRDRELEGLIDVVIALKLRRKMLPFGPPYSVGEVVDTERRAARRNIRNILLHLMFPNEYERIASSDHKRRAVEAFANLLDKPAVPPTMVAVDRQLYEIRIKLQKRWPARQIDFYNPEILAIWNPPPEPTEGEGRKQARAKTTKQRAHDAEADAVETHQTGQAGGVASEFLDGESANFQTRAAVAAAHHLAHGAHRAQPTPDLFFAAFIALAKRTDYDSPAAEALYAFMSDRSPPDDPARMLLGRYGIGPEFEVPLETSQMWPGPALAPILDAGDRLRTRVGRPTLQPLSPRHILAVLLLPGPHSVAPVLAELGYEPADLRATLFGSLNEWREDYSEWRRILLDVGKGEPAPDVAIYAGFSTDALRVDEAAAITRKDDRLNVMRDVTALAEVLAARDTKPPLAVGLFGDWGTGKSFFMELMRQEIELLGRENPGFYCERVVQVWFNAWHYMESNLWASLASRVFEELSNHLEKKWKVPDERTQLFVQLEQSEGVLAEAVSERAEAKARLEGIQQAVTKRERSLAGAARIAFDTAATALRTDEAVQSRMQEVTKEIGLPDAQKAVEKAAEQGREVLSLGRRIAALAHALRQQPVLLGVGIIVFAAVTGAVAWALSRQWNWRIVPGALAGLSAGLAAARAVVAPVIRQVRSTVGWLEGVVARLRDRAETDRRERELAAQRDLLRLETQEREARARVEALNREIEDLRAGRRLQRFILERHTSAEYRQHLGLVNLIRKDFEKLSQLLLESEKENADSRKAAVETGSEEEKTTAAAEDQAPADDREPEPPTNAGAGDRATSGDDSNPGASTPGGGGKPPAPLPKIDRIVLYIDDLDRCPEDRVVQVLQAVHLLLAFPLFVVVVGVDSRWLLLSLEDHYAALRGTSAGARDDGRGNGKKPEAEWNTTPQNYLEKIFQIPFSLRPMDSGGFSDLVTSLLPIGVEDGEEDGDRNGQGEQRERSGEPRDPDSSGGEQEPPDGEGDADENDEDVDDLDGGDIDPVGEEQEKEEVIPIVVRTNPQGLTVGKRERELIQNLYPLISSPRALKRFTNVYRFLRVQQRGEALARFHGGDGRAGEFEVVALLLGAVVGYPAEAAHLLRAVLANRGRPFWTLVEELGDAGADEDAATRAAVAGRTPPTGEHGRKTLREALLEVRQSVKIGEHSPGVFAEWTREVARFSFQSGRILSFRTADDVEEADDPV